MFTLKLSAVGPFAAAHANGPEGHKCNTTHGHDWTVDVEWQSNELDENGWAVDMDFGMLKQHVRDVIGQFDHQDLNEVFAPAYDDLERKLAGRAVKPSAEMLSYYIFQALVEDGA